MVGYSFGTSPAHRMPSVKAKFNTIQIWSATCNVKQDIQGSYMLRHTHTHKMTLPYRGFRGVGSSYRECIKFKSCSVRCGGLPIQKVVIQRHIGRQH